MAASGVLGNPNDAAALRQAGIGNAAGLDANKSAASSRADQMRSVIEDMIVDPPLGIHLIKAFPASRLNLSKPTGSICAALFRCCHPPALITMLIAKKAPPERALGNLPGLCRLSPRKTRVGMLYTAMVILGPILLGAGLLWVATHNRQTRREKAETERATRENYEQQDAEDKRRS